MVLADKASAVYLSIKLKTLVNQFGATLICRCHGTGEVSAVVVNVGRRRNIVSFLGVEYKPHTAALSPTRIVIKPLLKSAIIVASY